MKIERILWDEYFFDLLDGISRRSTCLRRQIGALFVKENQILTTGYNGAPPGISHCTDKEFCLREELKVPSGQRAEICYATHAEGNGIYQATKHGISLRGSTLYVKASPCSYCTKALLSVGVKRVVYKDIYPDDLAAKLRKEATWVKFEQYKSKSYTKKITPLYDNERLKPLENYPGYFISSYGRIFKNCVLGLGGEVSKLGEEVRKIFDLKKNRYYVIFKKGIDTISESVEILVAQTYLENSEGYHNVRHKDGNSANNYIDNLEWYSGEGKR